MDRKEFLCLLKRNSSFSPGTTNPLFPKEHFWEEEYDGHISRNLRVFDNYVRLYYMIRSQFLEELEVEEEYTFDEFINSKLLS